MKGFKNLPLHIVFTLLIGWSEEVTYKKVECNLRKEVSLENQFLEQ